MSVLIKGFEMPKDGCKDCAMVKRGNVFDICPFLKREVNGNVERGGKPYGCPLVEVPDTNVVDTISRQTAIDALYHVDEYNGRSVEAIKNLPPAQPETAKRIVGKSKDGMTLWYQCDMCNEPVDEQDNYCRGCGRRLTDE